MIELLLRKSNEDTEMEYFHVYWEADNEQRHSDHKEIAGLQPWGPSQETESSNIISGYIQLSQTKTYTHTQANSQRFALSRI